MVSKKQKEKRKDFQKQKLRIGKSTGKPANQTDISYVAKQINLQRQSLGTEKNAVNHFLTLTKHYSHNTRKEALVGLLNNALDITDFRAFFSATAPLILDTSKPVRDALYELYKSDTIAPQLAPNASLVMLYVHSAMTHITPDVRSQSTAFLDLLVEHAPKQVVTLTWIKTLSCFLPLLGWESSSAPKLSSGSIDSGLQFGSRASDVKLAHIQSLSKLISAGIDEGLDKDVNAPFTLNKDTVKFLRPTTGNPYVILGLFSDHQNSNPSSTTTVTEDVESRQEALKSFKEAIVSGLTLCTKEGGQLGRLSSGLLQSLNQISV